MKRISIDELELGAILGTGTVGTVYRAKFKSSGQLVAVKILQESVSNDELVRARFRREMQILQRFNHPNIIQYYGGGESDGRLFFAMELLEHGTARDLLDRFGHLSWQEVAAIGRQVCSALQCAHNNGVIHRDLKPSNLFLAADAVVKLGDFGIARDTRAADITFQGLTVGTHAYMAPEQITGEEHINGKADLYSLGCVMFELLTGRKPFEGTNFAVMFEQHLRKPPPRVSEFVPDCPAALTDVVDCLLQKDPDQRPFNARAVQGVLIELLESPNPASAVLPQTHSHVTHSHVTAAPAVPNQHDVAAAAVQDATDIDAGRASLARKLQPEARPEFTWKALILIASAIVLVIALAIISSGSGAN